MVNVFEEVRYEEVVWDVVCCIADDRIRVV